MGPLVRLSIVSVALGAAVAIAGCQLFVDSDPGSGIGTDCRDDDECQGSRCIDGFCSKDCSAPQDCPAPSACTSKKICEIPLHAGFVYAGDPAAEEWSRAHEDGRASAQKQLSFLTTEAAAEQDPDDVPKTVRAMIKRGATLIVGTSPALSAAISLEAASHPDVTFLNYASAAAGNVIPFSTRTYQVTYLAGRAAARRSKTRRLGMIGSYVTPLVVAQINGFALGARSLDPEIVTEVRWLGFYHDIDRPNGSLDSKERVLTTSLLDAGCDVVTHTLDNGRPVQTVEESSLTGRYSIGANVADACKLGPTRCLGATYYNWGPFYARALTDIRAGAVPRGSSIQENVRVDKDQSAIAFDISGPPAGGEALVAGDEEVLAALATNEGVRSVFTGPLCSTGQRKDAMGQAACLADGEVLGEEEVQRMCWFAEGVVEPDAEPGTTKDALVPEEGDCKPMAQ